MPLNARVLRNGKPRRDLPWNGGEGNAIERNFRAEALLNAFLTTALKEGDPDLVITASGKRAGELPDGTLVRIADTGVYYIDTKCPLWKTGRLVLQRDHHFTYDDGTPFVEFLAGDVLEMFRT